MLQSREGGGENQGSTTRMNSESYALCITQSFTWSYVPEAKSWWKQTPLPLETPGGCRSQFGMNTEWIYVNSMRALFPRSRCSSKQQMPTRHVISKALTGDAPPMSLQLMAPPCKKGRGMSLHAVPKQRIYKAPPRFHASFTAVGERGCIHELQGVFPGIVPFMASDERAGVRIQNTYIS